MALVFLILVLLAVMHFIYESIILPSVRLSMRFKLFALRDQLRRLVEDKPEARDAFNIQQSAINNTIKLIVGINGAAFSKFKYRMSTDEALRKRVEKRTKVVSEFDCEEFQEIVDKTAGILMDAAFANMGTWNFYIVPFAVVLICIKKMWDSSKGIANVPEGELGKVVEFETAFAAAA